SSIDGLLAIWTNRQVERMNRTLKDAIVRRYHYGSHDQLHKFVMSTTWNDAPLRLLLVEKADRRVGGPMPCGWSATRLCPAGQALGRWGAPVPLPVGLRRFLPEIWMADAGRAAPQPASRQSTGQPRQRPASP
ncbi:MAG TPA: hypothetical protein VNS22_23605, partial [Geminicoccus sp.]|nr:hypothetical protein [Geminicoccus sp.]